MEFSNSLTLLILGQGLTIIALIISNFINYRHTTKLYREQIETETSIRKQAEFLEKQLSEFYGPIQALLSVQNLLIKLRWNAETKKNTKVVEDEVWYKVRDEIMIPNAHKIADIIVSKYHLLDETELPESYKQYITHAYMWPIRVFFEDNKDIEWDDFFRFPTQFRTDIDNHTKRVKQEYFRAIKKQKIEQ